MQRLSDCEGHRAFVRAEPKGTPVPDATTVRTFFEQYGEVYDVYTPVRTPDVCYVTFRHAQSLDKLLADVPSGQRGRTQIGSVTCTILKAEQRGTRPPPAAAGSFHAGGGLGATASAGSTYDPSDPSGLGSIDVNALANLDLSALQTAMATGAFDANNLASLGVDLSSLGDIGQLLGALGQLAPLASGGQDVAPASTEPLALQDQAAQGAEPGLNWADLVGLAQSGGVEGAAIASLLGQGGAQAAQLQVQQREVQQLQVQAASIQTAQLQAQQLQVQAAQQREAQQLHAQAASIQTAQLQAQQLQVQQLQVQAQQPEAQAFPTAGDGRVCVFGMPAGLNADMLRGHFSWHGDIVDIYIPVRMPEMAYITFQNQMQSQDAVMHSGLKIAGFMVKEVKMAEPRGQKCIGTAGNFLPGAAVPLAPNLRFTPY